MTALVLVSPATAEPIARAEAKAHLRVDSTDDDVLIDALIAAARGQVEAMTGRALVLQRFKLQLDAFPATIRLPRAPAVAIDSIVYIDAAGVSQTLAASGYAADLASQPARVAPAYGEVWPETRDQMNAVSVTFRAGHATPFTSDATSDIVTATDHPFANADRLRLTTAGGTIPTGLAALADYFARDVSGNTLKLAATSGGAAIDITAAGTGLNFLGEIPGPARSAMLLLIGAWYEHREQIIAGTIVSEIQGPAAVERLLWPLRLFW